MLCLDSFQTITQFIGPEDCTLDKAKEHWMSGNLDVLKLYDVLTNFNVYCYYILIKWCYIVFYCIYQSLFQK